MQMKSLNLVAVTAIAAFAIGLTSAQGASNRAWVSGHGVDQAGCGPPTTTCRSLQYAHDSAVVAGGEIDILDPAGYGAITITKAVSIVNDGVGTAGVQATSGDAITINAAPSDAVYLRGLNIDGVDFAANRGVVFNTGGHLAIVNCVVGHFKQAGIEIDPTTNARFLISDTLIASNHDIGLFIQSAGADLIGSVDRVTANEDVGGVAIVSIASGGSVAVALTNANASNNTAGGVFVSASVAANVVVTLDNVEANLNAIDGLFVSGFAVAHLSRSVFNQNTVSGVFNNTTTPGAVDSIGDNVARGNISNNVVGVIGAQSPF